MSKICAALPADRMKADALLRGVPEDEDEEEDEEKRGEDEDEEADDEGEGYSIDVPVARLPLGSSGEHACNFTALGVDRDDPRNVGLETLNNCWPVCFVLNKHRDDWPVPIS